MKIILNTSIILLCMSLLISCIHNCSFDQEVWIENNSDEILQNPRAKMMTDLRDHHLYSGMTKESVIALLGLPLYDKLEKGIPEGIEVPDSVPTLFVGSSNEEIQNKIDKYNSWSRQHSQIDTLLLYPVGWSTIDPNYLVIRMDEDGLVKDWNVEQY